MQRVIISLLLVSTLFIYFGCKNDVAPTNSAPKLQKNGGIISVPGDFATIQEAINNAKNGDVIKVSEGTYYEQVEISGLNELTIEGHNATITVPPGGMTGSLVKVIDCQNFNFTGFTIDGDNGVNVSYGAINSGGDADTRFYGLFMINSSGQINGNKIVNVSWHNGVQQGIGMYVYAPDGLQHDINIQENVVTNFQKGGISVRGLFNFTINKNTITHWGETGIIAGNGLQVDGGTGSITNNIISNSKYYDENHTSWAAANILLIASTYSADNIKVINNIVFDGDVGIWVIDFGAGLTNTKVISNTIYGNIWDGPFGPDDLKAHANKYQ